MDIIQHKPFTRADRLADEIKQIVGEILIKDIQIHEANILTITKVKMTPDLKTAKVFFSYINDEKSPEDVLEAIKPRIKAIRFLMGKKLQIKYLPQLRFHFDDSLVKAEMMEVLFRKIHTDNEE